MLEKLREAGSDLTQPHALDFFLYLPTESAAHEANAQLHEMGFRVSVGRSATNDSWLCEAHKSMVPTLAAVIDLRARFTALAASLGGEYDGWGTEVTK